jgi:hypothetical protein
VASRSQKHKGGAKPSDKAAEEQSPAAEHPRRVTPIKRHYEDKQLRPDRVRGGFDTK